jgi:hypothetical protein
MGLSPCLVIRDASIQCTSWLRHCIVLRIDWNQREGDGGKRTVMDIRDLHSRLFVAREKTECVTCRSATENWVRIIDMSLCVRKYEA